jgi:hypothetical protein
MKSLLVATALIFASVPAMAEFTKLAECTGASDTRLNARAVLFVNKAADTQGLIEVSFDDGTDFLSATQINWKANSQGYPRFYNNDFDLDIVINDKTKSTDDILVGKNYVGQLDCTYTPNLEK